MLIISQKIRNDKCKTETNKRRSGMLQSLKVTGLFGRFNYDLSFKEDIMIITGPNGYGKSTILRIINDLCNDSFEKVISYSFKTLTIVCDNNDTFKITKNKNEFKINEYAFPYPEYNQRRDFFSIVIRHERAVEELLKQWSDNEQKFVLSIVFASGYQFSKKESSEIINKLSKANESIKNIQKSIGRVYYIQEQRLIETKTIPENERRDRQSEVKYVSVINENSEKLKKELAEIMKKHSQLSSNLDSTYIKRLFETDTEQASADLSDKLKELQKKQKKLQQYGLAEIQNASYLNSQLTETKLKKFGIELSIYLEDANAKYQVFESIINKLDLYKRIVNEKLTFKEMHLSSADGIVVKTTEGETLSLNDLSSGEKEIIVLFYKLIFESDVDLLLIDEPEISLHIVWQNELMENLKSVVELKKNIRVIIATHSPEIISDDWDLQIDLGEQYNG